MTADLSQYAHGTSVSLLRLELSHHPDQQAMIGNRVLLAHLPPMRPQLLEREPTLNLVAYSDDRLGAPGSTDLFGHILRHGHDKRNARVVKC